MNSSKTLKLGGRDIYERVLVVGLLLSLLVAGFAYARFASAVNGHPFGYGYGYGYGYGNIFVTGQKFNDLDGNGNWDKGEPTIPGWPIQVHRLEGVNGDGIPTELVGLSLTGGDGSFSIPLPGPGHYRVSEPEVDGWRNTAPADSFFDVFAEIGDGEIDRDVDDRPLNFGNTEVPPRISEETAGSSTAASFVVTWTTDSPATSRVIYDTVSHPVLGDAPNYGYAHSTVESDTDPKVTDHSVTLTGLTPNTTYYYRTVSKGSPESVSGERSHGTSLSEPSPPGTSSGGGGGGGTVVTPPPAGQVAGAAIAGCQSYSRNLTVGMRGADVVALQEFLVGRNTGSAAQALAQVLTAGVPKGYFGSLTRTAVAEFQAANNISPAVGYFGSLTRARVASICGGEVQGATATQLQALQAQLLSLLQQYLNLLQQQAGQ